MLRDQLKKRYTDGHEFLKDSTNGSNGSSVEEIDRAYRAGYNVGRSDGYAQATQATKSDYRRRSQYARNYKRTETYGKYDDPSGNVTMPFGKHRGKFLREFPLEYCAWALREVETLDPKLEKAMKSWLEANGFPF
jgi:uncharacterized protein (DUF3820 family)